MYHPLYRSAILLVVLLFCQISGQAGQAPLPATITPSATDSIILKKVNREKTVVIRKGDEVKLWIGGDFPVTGAFKTRNGEHLTINTRGQDMSVPIAEIEAIKRYSSNGAMFLGALLVAAGWVALGLGGVGLVAGLISLLAGDIGVIILVAVLPLGLLGWGLLKLGHAIPGGKFKMGKRWRILPA